MRNAVAKVDLYQPHSYVLRFANLLLIAYERVHSAVFREKALKEVLFLVEAENANTDFLCLGPVNFAVNMVVAFATEGRGMIYFY